MIRSLVRPTTGALVVPVLFFALLTALTARVTIPLPFTVVPITLQTFAVVLGALVLGSRGGALCQLLYLAAIATGLPLSASGIGGPAAFLTPTAGYLLAFVPAAYLTGYLVEQGDAERRISLLRQMIAALCGMVVIYLGGTAWLSLFLGSVSAALQQGVLPFIGVDLAKAVIAALVAGGGRLMMQPFIPTSDLSPK